MDDLIGTKLNMPPLQKCLLERAHLLDRLSRGKDARMVVICGVAGSGKTSLACQWIAREGLRLAWYSLDKTDNEGDVFFRYLAASIASCDSRLVPLVSACFPPGAFSERRVIQQIIRHVDDYSDDIYLVLDDFHFATSGAIHTALAGLLRDMPANLHLVILSRHTIPFSLSPLRIKDQIVEIFPFEMRFSEQETERFFADVMPVSLASREVREAARRMDGWVGGLQLLALSLKERRTPLEMNDILRKANRTAIDFLVEEVIDVQTAEIKAFLEATAPLDRFSAETARAITGNPSAGEVLDHVYRNNLFLIPLDAEGRWYRYHNIFSEAAEERMRASSPDRLRRIHQEAALWFAKNGQIEDAFRNAFASDDLEFAADLLEDHLMTLYDRYEIDSFRRWLARVPFHILSQRPLLRLHECRLKLESVQLLEAEKMLQELEADRAERFSRYEGPKRTLCEDYLMLFGSVLAFWLDPIKVDVDQLNRNLSRISPANKSFAGMIGVIIGSSHLFRGELSLAGQASLNVMSAARSSESLLVEMMWFRLMAAIERWQGHLHRAEAILNDGFSVLERTRFRDAPLGCLLNFEMAWIRYFQDGLDDALDYATKALAFLTEAGFAWEIVEANFLLSLILLARGEAERASRCAHEMQAVSRSSGESYVIALSDACCARLYLAQGDTVWAESWAAQRKPSVDSDAFSFCLIQESLACAELLCHQGRHRQAVGILEGLRQSCMSRKMMEVVLEIDVLCSQALYATRDRDRARAVLEGALAFSEAEGYVRPLLKNARGVAPVLASLVRRGIPSKNRPHLERIMKGCGMERETPGTGDDSRRARLSPRETEIVKLLAAGYKYREIAEKAFISIDTVRTHIRSVFEKLEVNNRTQAIHKADKLGILD